MLKIFAPRRIIKFTGAAVLSYWLLYLPINGIYAHFIREPYNLKSRYGEKSWAIVTGGSDGIGKGFANQLAKQGFNIYLVSRTEEKLKLFSEELTNNHKVEVKYRAKDFTKSHEAEFFDDIFEDTKDLDVSILVNNVGMAFKKQFPEADIRDIKDTIAVNTFPQALMTREYLERMRKRDKKSAIINLSSFYGSKPIAPSPLYSATKAFNDFLSRSLSYEFNEKVDIISLRPCFVSSAMNNFKPVGGFTISPDECAEETLKKLGYDSWTFGHWKHSLVANLALLVPDSIFQNKMIEGYRKRNSQK